jgi:hypothetical protein
MTMPPARVTPSPHRPSNHAPDGALASAGEAALRHAREGTIVLRGPYSGRVYRFSHHGATAVLAEDVGALLRTGVLERANR